MVSFLRTEPDSEHQHVPSQNKNHKMISSVGRPIEPL